MYGNVLHFIGVDEKGNEIKEKGEFIKETIVDGNIYYIMKVVDTNEEVYVSPEMIMSLY